MAGGFSRRRPDRKESGQDGFGPKKEFSVRVDGAGQIFEALRKGKQGVLGMAIFDIPQLNRVIAEAILVDGKFHLIVHFDPDLLANKTINLSQLMQNLSTRFESRPVSFGNRSMAFRFGPAATEFFFEANLEAGFDVSTGYTTKRPRPIHVAEPLALERRTVSNAVYDAAEMIRVVVDEICLLHQIPLPKGEMVLSPPSDESLTALLTGEVFAEEKKSITLEQVGGNADAKRALRLLIASIKHAEVFQQWSARPPKGVLLHGPPGTGKTRMARAVAHEIEAQFIHIKSTDFGSHWFSLAESNLRNKIMEALKFPGYSVIYFEEMDTMFPARGITSGVENRILDVVIQIMDGMESHDRLIFMGSTNHMKGIDEALLRPGRMDLKILVDLPDDAARQEIFAIHMNAAEAAAKRVLFAWPKWPEVIAATKGWSGADIEGFIRTLLAERAYDQVQTGKIPKQISRREFMEQLEKFASNTSAKKKDNRPPMGFRGVREQKPRPKNR